MKNVSYLKKLSIFSLLTLLITASASMPSKVKAQDEGSDEETIIPVAPSDGSSTAPTTIPLDDSDAESVQNVEEYDG